MAVSGLDFRHFRHPGRTPSSVADLAVAPWLSLTFDSTLALSGGVAGGVHQEAEELGWRIGQQRGAGRGWRILVSSVRPDSSCRRSGDDARPASQVEHEFTWRDSEQIEIRLADRG